MNKINLQENLVGWGLAFVFAWFGMNEILSPAQWTAYVPSFLGQGPFIVALVVIHGLVLFACAVLLVIGIGRMYVGILSSLLVADIVVVLIMQNGLDPVSVRDIGLFAAALSLIFTKKIQFPARMTVTGKPGIFPEKYN